ncbi:hypothetical protein BJX61DRAFT_551886 [Aspergillus egyptiacus]|nr:hypothetical protein BJX61DRAFT_551886 [Aspergillus egyptiacus]
MASIPDECTVLVVGGGPAGSYAASALAREGIDVTLLEADVFPRYHIGESTLPSMRYFLRFIDCESKFDKHGFARKNGASFKFNSKPQAYTDFIARKGPGNSAWNVIRSEADDILFRHAGESGALIFDGVKANSYTFAPESDRPVAATWSRKDGTSGTIRFKYLVDATGRAGLMSTKYLKNRNMNDSLKDGATWGYWEGAEYPDGMKGKGDPISEAIGGGIGWVWAIPLHNGTISVGVVVNQERMTQIKRELEISGQELYHRLIQRTGLIKALLGKATLVSGIRSASDWSYSATSYAGPNWRIAGDAGCFIDPFYSSGIHLALTGGLSAALTISAAERGHCDSEHAARWHTAKVGDAYSRFLLVVSSSLKQISDREDPVLTAWEEENFDRAFDIFRPVIQGDADIGSEIIPVKDNAKVFDFCVHAILSQKTDNKAIEVDELADQLGLPGSTITYYLNKVVDVVQTNETGDIDDFSSGAFNGFSPVIQRGSLGLAKA